MHYNTRLTECILLDVNVNPRCVLFSLVKVLAAAEVHHGTFRLYADMQDYAYSQQ